MVIEKLLNSKLHSVVFVMLLLSYLGLVFTYSVIELKNILLFVFLPALIGPAALFSIFALFNSKPISNAAGIGGQLGCTLALGLFLSNFLISTPYRDGYTVTRVSVGRGASVNWLINTKQRDNVFLYVNAKGVSIETSPSTVKLLLNRGWLGFYFGNIA